MRKWKVLFFVCVVVACGESGSPVGPLADGAVSDRDAQLDADTSRDASLGSEASVDGRVADSAGGDAGLDSAAPRSVDATLTVAHNSSCAVNQGKVYCWGSAQFGQLGEGTRDGQPHATPLELPISDAVFVRLSRWANHVVTDNGELWVSGLNNLKQLPFETTTLQRVEVEPVSLGVGSYDVGCIVMRSDGEVLCRGNNDLGGVGDGSAETRDSYVSTGITSASSISAGLDFVCAVSSGDVFCWGNNNKGQLGNGEGGDGEFEATPVLADVPGTAVQVAAGSRHACARNTAGEAYCWGTNWGKQAGSTWDDEPCGVHDCLRAPTKVDATVSGDLALSDGASCAISDGGSVRCWGSGSVVSGGAKVSSASALASGHESNHFCAQTSTEVLCWGNGDGLGQLGRGVVQSNEQAASPAAVAFP